MKKETNQKPAYAYYSRVLNEAFDTVEELKLAEEAYFAKLKAKEDKAAQKKADATKVEDAFKALNAARKTYKEKLVQLTTEYSEALTELKKAFELGKKDIQGNLAKAEDAYAKALKDFTDKYEQYHFTLRDGDFETTISNKKIETDKLFEKSSFKEAKDLLDLIFKFY